MRCYLRNVIAATSSKVIISSSTSTHKLISPMSNNINNSLCGSLLDYLHPSHRKAVTVVMRYNSSTNGVSPSPIDLSAFASGVRHVLADCPKTGVKVSDLHKRMVKALGEGADYKVFGFATMSDSLSLACDSLYIVRDSRDKDKGLSDDESIVVPCLWAEVLMRVSKKLPFEGVLEPALQRYISAEGCPRFKSAMQSLPMGPGNMMYQSLKDWLIDTQLNTIIEPVDVPSHSYNLHTVEDTDVMSSTAVVYRCIDNVSPNVMLLRNALSTIGCKSPASMPVSVNLRDIASVLHPLPELFTEGTTDMASTATKNYNARCRYTWPEFLQLPEIKKHFTVEIDMLLQTRRVSGDTTVVLVDGTEVGPDDAEAAVHRWVARERIRLSQNGDNDAYQSNKDLMDGDGVKRRTSSPVVVKTSVFVIRYDTNFAHISNVTRVDSDKNHNVISPINENNNNNNNNDIVMFDDVLDCYHAMAAKLASIALGAQKQSSDHPPNNGNSTPMGAVKDRNIQGDTVHASAVDEAAAIAMPRGFTVYNDGLTSETLAINDNICGSEASEALSGDNTVGLGSEEGALPISALGHGYSPTVVIVCKDSHARDRLGRGLEHISEELGGTLRFEYMMTDEGNDELDIGI